MTTLQLVCVNDVFYQGYLLRLVTTRYNAPELRALLLRNAELELGRLTRAIAGRESASTPRAA